MGLVKKRIGELEPGGGLIQGRRKALNGRLQYRAARRQVVFHLRRVVFPLRLQPETPAQVQQRFSAESALRKPIRESLECGKRLLQTVRDRRRVGCRGGK